MHRAPSTQPSSDPVPPRPLRLLAAPLFTVSFLSPPASGAAAQPEIPEDLDFSEIFDWVIIAILVISWLLPVLIGLAKKLKEGDENGEFEKGKEVALPEGNEPIEPG